MRIESFYKGIRRFDIDKSIDAIRDAPQININRDLNDVSRQVSLMNLQYTSPAAMDVYKYLTTIAHLRLLMRVEQYLDLERSIDDDTVRLRKQAEYDCLKSKSIDMERAFIDCYQQARDPLEGLSDPANRSNAIQNQQDVMAGLVVRVTNQSYFTQINQLMPKLLISTNKVIYQKPVLDVYANFMRIKLNKIQQIQELYQRYMDNQKIDSDLLENINHTVMFIDQRWIEQLGWLTQAERYIAINALAFRMAVIENQMQYDQMITVLQSLLIAPYVQAGWHAYIDKIISHFQHQMSSFYRYINDSEELYHFQSILQNKIQQRH
jgi:TM2 domain-containing membrane protein YozV